MTRAKPLLRGLNLDNGSLVGGFSRTLPFFPSPVTPVQPSVMGAVRKVSEGAGSVSLLTSAAIDYALMDLSLYTSPDVRDFTIGDTGSTASVAMDLFTQGAAPAADGSSTDVLGFGCTVVATDSNVSSQTLQLANLNRGAISSNFNGAAAADEANGALLRDSDIQVVNGLSPGGSDGALGMPQGSLSQFSMTPFGNPGSAPSAMPSVVWTGGEGTPGYQIPTAGLHVIAAGEGDGVPAVTASFAAGTFAPVPADLASLANPLAGSFKAPVTDSSIGPNGATPAQVQEALDATGLSVNGAGIRVGVLSDSFNDLGGAAADEADGALPPASDIQVLQDLPSGGTDEGRAMMQIVHDIAPGADLAFYTAFISEQAFANGILALAADGCKVIVDDVSYFDEPFFQNGVVAQAIQTVEAEGVTYITAAGNDANNAYQAAWTPISGTYDGTRLTDAESFGGSLVQTITLQTEGYEIPLLLEWNQAYGEATSDLEILVFRNGRLYGTATNRSSGEPTNPWVDFTFTASGTYQIAIVNLSGPNPGLIKEITEGDGLPVTISGANVGTVYGHAMTPGAITVGAVDTADTPGFGVSSPISETYSSSGAGTELLFANNGTSQSPDLLSPVSVSGVDNINTTVSDLTDFYGTSAAAASMAGVAVLVLSADPNLTPAAVELILQSSAVAMANPAVSGAGLVQADVAVAEALAVAASPGPIVLSLMQTSSAGVLGIGKTVTITLDFSEIVTVTGGSTSTLSLNDGGTANYTGGSGTGALTFSYTVAPTDNSVSSLSVLSINPNGDTITDSGGNNANLSLSDLIQSGPQIDTTIPTMTSVLETPSTGNDLGIGKTVTITLDLNEVGTVVGSGKLTLTLNDGGTATYSSGSGTDALTFSYTVGATDSNETSLAVHSINLNGDTITDAAGNNATLSTLSLTGLSQIGPQIDTMIPTVTSVAASTSSGVATLGDKLTLTLDLSEAVTVSGGIPTLSLNDGGKATYDAAESSATTLVFDYTVAAGQYAQTLAITGISLNGATIKDVVVGNVANLAGADSSITGLQVDATIPTVVADRSHDTLGGSLSEAATLGVLAHDTDADPSDILSVSAVDGLAGNVGIAVTGAYGTLTLNANGSYSYSNTNSAAVTAAGGVAVDVFTYTVSNGDGDTATSTLDIVITSSGQTYEAAAAGATLDGGTGSYVLDGGAGKDTLVAGKGTQVLIGGPGDMLTGAKGYSDMFVFAPGFGDDTIRNFSTTSDTIQLSHLEFANFSAVLADARQVGNNVVITYDANDVITLTGVQLSQLHAADFHFA
jgi:VCBS repeat-containing protein